MLHSAHEKLTKWYVFSVECQNITRKYVLLIILSFFNIKTPDWIHILQVCVTTTQTVWQGESSGVGHGGAASAVVESKSACVCVAYYVA